MALATVSSCKRTSTDSLVAAGEGADSKPCRLPRPGSTQEAALRRLGLAIIAKSSADPQVKAQARNMLVADQIIVDQGLGADEKMQQLYEREGVITTEGIVDGQKELELARRFEADPKYSNDRLTAYAETGVREAMVDPQFVEQQVARLESNFETFSHSTVIETELTGDEKLKFTSLYDTTKVMGEAAIEFLEKPPAAVEQSLKPNSPYQRALLGMVKLRISGYSLLMSVAPKLATSVQNAMLKYIYRARGQLTARGLDATTELRHHVAATSVRIRGLAPASEAFGATADFLDRVGVMQSNNLENVEATRTERITPEVDAYTSDLMNEVRRATYGEAPSTGQRPSAGQARYTEVERFGRFLESMERELSRQGSSVEQATTERFREMAREMKEIGQRAREQRTTVPVEEIESRMRTLQQEMLQVNRIRMNPEQLRVFRENIVRARRGIR